MVKNRMLRPMVSVRVEGPTHLSFAVNIINFANGAVRELRRQRIATCVPGVGQVVFQSSKVEARSW